MKNTKTTHSNPFFGQSGKRVSVLVIDNYDSFVYNLVHYLEALDYDVTVWRNDEVDLPAVKNFDKILLSPGPGVPHEAGLLLKLIEEYASSKPILGVCLGMQAIAEVFGAKLHNLPSVFHGVSTKINWESDAGFYKDLPQKMEVGRYHSWVVKDLPNCLTATAYDENREIMAIKHRDFDLRGVQFHPESVLTPLGKTMLKNWVELN